MSAGPAAAEPGAKSAAVPSAAVPSAAVPFAGTAALAEAAPTRFRLFKRGPWRKAFRLEDVFWDVLEQAAASEGLKLADYVRRLAAPFGPEVNVSSQIRVRVVEWLVRRCRLLEQAQAPDRLMASVLAAPVPCFVISAGRDLVRSNAEFQAYLAERAGLAQAGEPGSVTMALDAPVSRIVALLAAGDGRALACGFTLRSGATTMSGRARVALLPPGRDLVVGYVLPEPPRTPAA